MTKKKAVRRKRRVVKFHRGLSRVYNASDKTVAEWVRSGCPFLSEQPLTFDLDQVDEWLRIRKSPKAPPPEGGDRPEVAGAIPSPMAKRRATAETKIKERQAEMAGIELKKAKGELVDREWVYRVWRRHITDARVLFQTIPDAIAMLIPNPELKELVRSEGERIVHDALRAMAAGDIDQQVEANTQS